MLLKTRYVVTSLLLVAVALLVIACGGVSQSDFDAAKQALSAQDQKVTALQQQLSAKEKEVADANKKAADKDKEIAQLKATGGEPGKFPLIFGKVVPTPTPRPSPTPLPAGAPSPTPAPPRSAPASYFEPVGAFAFYVETLSSGSVSNFGFVGDPSCVPNSVFKRGMKIVWRFEVIDLSTGKRVTDRDGATIRIRLPHGEEVSGRFSQRGGGSVPDAPWMWAAAWHIPPDYPVGALDYVINVTSRDGRAGTFKMPALVSPAGTDSRVRIIS